MKKLLFLFLLFTLLWPRKFIITIDDVPAPHTKEILSYIEKKNYFVIWFFTEKAGSFNNNIQIINRIISNTNFIIGNHTKSHDFNLMKYGNYHFVLRDMMEIHNYFHKLGYNIWLFRPPYGYLSNSGLRAVLRMNYKIMIWNMEIIYENKLCRTTKKINKQELKDYFDYHYPLNRDICVLLFHVNKYIKTNIKTIFETIEEYGEIATKKDFYENKKYILK